MDGWLSVAVCVCVHALTVKWMSANQLRHGGQANQLCGGIELSLCHLGLARPHNSYIKFNSIRSVGNGRGRVGYGPEVAESGSGNAVN